jgi:hypothetical protein
VPGLRRQSWMVRGRGFGRGRLFVRHSCRKDETNAANLNLDDPGRGGGVQHNGGACGQRAFHQERNERQPERKHLVCGFKEAGLESGSIENVTCSATQEITYECVNNGGKNPSASNKRTFRSDSSASGQFPADRNGNITGTLTNTPVSASSLGFSCPSGQTLTLVSVTYSNISITDSTSGASINVSGSFTYTNPSAP